MRQVGLKDSGWNDHGAKCSVTQHLLCFLLHVLDNSDAGLKPIRRSTSLPTQPPTNKPASVCQRLTLLFLEQCLFGAVGNAEARPDRVPATLVLVIYMGRQDKESYTTQLQNLTEYNKVLNCVV